MSSHKSAQGQSGLSASGLWSWGHLLAMAVPLLMVLSAAIGPALVTRPNRGLGTVQSVVIASTLLQAENSRAAPIDEVEADEEEGPVSPPRRLPGVSRDRRQAHLDQRATRPGTGDLRHRH